MRNWATAAPVGCGELPRQQVFWPCTQPPFPHSGGTCEGAEGAMQQQALELRPSEYRVLLCVDIGEARG